MNVDELKAKLGERIPNQEMDKNFRVVVARKKKRGGYDIYPCVKDVELAYIPIPGETNPVAAIVFED
jgi:hypothetical protein